jgi:DNA polymerase III delta prime subunit
MQPPPALVLSGPPGVGKTSVGWRIFDRCTDLDLAPAFADLDLLGAAWPAPTDDPHQSRLKATNLAAVWSNCRQSGSRRLIIAGVVEDLPGRRQLEQATGTPLLVCRLAAPDQVLAQRIQTRARESGPDLTNLIARSAQLSKQLTTTDISDHVIPTGSRPVDAIAAEILTHWQAAASPSAR